MWPEGEVNCRIDDFVRLSGGANDTPSSGRRRYTSGPQNSFQRLHFVPLFSTLRRQVEQKRQRSDSDSDSDSEAAATAKRQRSDSEATVKRSLELTTYPN